MADFYSRDHKKTQLPAPYVSPWSSILSNFRALFADLYLRLRELYRLNNEGILPTPKFFLLNNRKYFWPILIISTTVILWFLGGHFIRFYSDKGLSGIEQNIPPSKTSDSLLIQLNENSLINENLIDSQETTSYDDNAAERLNVLASLQEDDYYNYTLIGFFESFDISFLDNTVIIKVGSSMKNLTTNQQTEFFNHLVNSLDDIGYSDSRIFDEDGMLLARKSRVGDGVVLFTEGYL